MRLLNGAASLQLFSPDLQSKAVSLLPQNGDATPSFHHGASLHHFIFHQQCNTKGKYHPGAGCGNHQILFCLCHTFQGLQCPIQVKPTLPISLPPLLFCVIPSSLPHPLFINGCELCHRHLMLHSRDNTGAYCCQLGIIFPLTEQLAGQQPIRIHSAETALSSVRDVLQIARADSKWSVLILVDLSAAFDTITHQILLITGPYSNFTALV